MPEQESSYIQQTESGKDINTDRRAFLKDFAKGLAAIGLIGASTISVDKLSALYEDSLVNKDEGKAREFDRKADDFQKRLADELQSEIPANTTLQGFLSTDRGQEKLRSVLLPKMEAALLRISKPMEMIHQDPEKARYESLVKFREAGRSFYNIGFLVAVMTELAAKILELDKNKEAQRALLSRRTFLANFAGASAATSSLIESSRKRMEVEGLGEKKEARAYVEKAFELLSDRINGKAPDQLVMGYFDQTRAWKNTIASAVLNQKTYKAKFKCESAVECYAMAYYTQSKVEQEFSQKNQ